MFQALFGTRLTPEEKLRRFKRTIRQSTRELERSRRRIEREEAKHKQQIKALMAKGEVEAAMILTRDIVRNRRAMHKFMKLESQLQSLDLRITTIKAQSGVNNALKGAAQAMSQLNRMVRLPEMQAIMSKFMQENEMMDIKSELVDDQMDSLWDDEGTMEEDTYQQYSALFAEMKIPMPAIIQENVVPAARTGPRPI